MESLMRDMWYNGNHLSINDPSKWVALEKRDDSSKQTLSITVKAEKLLFCSSIEGEPEAWKKDRREDSFKRLEEQFKEPRKGIRKEQNDK